jgi:hypothetical protein
MRSAISTCRSTNTSRANNCETATLLTFLQRVSPRRPHDASFLPSFRGSFYCFSSQPPRPSLRKQTPSSRQFLSLLAFHGHLLPTLKTETNRASRLKTSTSGVIWCVPMDEPMFLLFRATVDTSSYPPFLSFQFSFYGFLFERCCRAAYK